MKYLDYLLNYIPDNVDYTEFPSELDECDITQDRIDGLIGLLYHSNDPIISFRSSCLLCSWGKEIGVRYIIDTTLSESSFIELFKFDTPNDICLNVVRSLVDYISIHTELIVSKNDSIRNGIILCLRKMILFGNVIDFDVKDTFLLVEYGIKDLLPDLESYFINKVKNFPDSLWIIYDFIIFFNKYNNSFLTRWIETFKTEYSLFRRMIKELDEDCYKKIDK